MGALPSIEMGKRKRLGKGEEEEEERKKVVVAAGGLYVCICVRGRKK